MVDNGLLPIGTVALLKDSTRRVMIVGVCQKSVNSGTFYDYAGVIFPEGFISPDKLFLFNNNQIKINSNVEIVMHSEGGRSAASPLAALSSFCISNFSMLSSAVCMVTPLIKNDHFPSLYHRIFPLTTGGRKSFWRKTRLIFVIPQHIVFGAGLRHKCHGNRAPCAG